MKILLTFIGNNDCYIDEKPGAILSILKEIEIDKLYIFYNNEKYLKPASNILKFCRKNHPELEVFYQEALTGNPIDYNTVYPAMYSAVKKVLEENRNENADYTISITSGTPTMHACWIFLQQGGVIDAELIQVSREKGISNIDFNLDDFPQIQDVDEVKTKLTKLSRENKNLKENLKLEYDNIIGNCDAIKKIKEKIMLLSDYDIPVFISGESGTGKELVAEALHYNSKRKEQQFIKINCGAISPELFESEFFGHKKGSFTGAINDKEGKFKEADKGTIFLDEIGDLPLQMQVKLFRVLEEGTIQPVGGKEDKVDVRIITATNKDLNKLVEDGDFREELLYRIVKQKIELPPLRHRHNDIMLLANYCISKLNQKHRQKKEITKDAIEIIEKHNWPGNIRELFSVLENAYIYPGKNIDSSKIDLHSINMSSNKVFIPEGGLDFDREIPRAYYEEALKISNGNAAAAARLLKLEEHTFRARLKKFGIES